MTVSVVATIRLSAPHSSKPPELQIYSPDSTQLYRLPNSLFATGNLQTQRSSSPPQQPLLSRQPCEVSASTPTTSWGSRRSPSNPRALGAEGRGGSARRRVQGRVSKGGREASLTLSTAAERVEVGVDGLGGELYSAIAHSPSAEKVITIPTVCAASRSGGARPP